MIDAAAREANGKVFVAHLTSVEHYDMTQLKLGKKADALWEQASELTTQLDRYSYGPTVRFADVEVDQARAAGVTIEFETGAPLIADRTLYPSWSSRRSPGPSQSLSRSSPTARPSASSHGR